MRRLAQMMGVLALLLMVLPASAQSSTSMPWDPSQIVPDQMIITLDDGYQLSATGSLFAGSTRLKTGLGLPAGAVLSAEALSQRQNVHLVKLRSGTDLRAAVTTLQQQQGIRYAEPDARRSMLLTPNDPIYSRQWGPVKINAEPAWDITTGSPIVIAIIDTGVSPTHPDLAGRVLPGYNAITGSGNSADDEGHGTSMAGIAAAPGNNGQGIAGMCWSCQILPVKVLDYRGSGTTSSIVRGLYWAADHGAQIVSMSLGGDERIRAEEDAINYVYSKGIPLFASAGNSGDDGNPVIYPAAFPHVIAVGATTPQDTVAGFSSFGDYVDVAAPGVGIWTTSWNQGDTYEAGSGTSPACPFVAGLGALAKSVWPELNPDQLEQLITGSAVDLMSPGKDPYSGWGRIDALKTLQNAVARTLPNPGQPNPPPPPPPSIPQPPTPPPSTENPAFIPVGAPPLPERVGETYFPETGHTLHGEFKNYWERNGGLAVFGFPISEEFTEQTAEGTYTVQYFERQRFEFHGEKSAPYNVLLGRLGDTVLRDRGIDWYGLPKGQPQDGCRYFTETQHTVCGEFLKYWNEHGLNDPALDGYSRSLQLFGFPISEPTMETNSNGDTVPTQWFERGRFELHDGKGVLLGFLAKEVAQHRGWR